MRAYCPPECPLSILLLQLELLVSLARISILRHSIYANPIILAHFACSSVFHVNVHLRAANVEQFKLMVR